MDAHSCTAVRATERMDRNLVVRVNLSPTSARSDAVAVAAPAFGSVLALGLPRVIYGVVAYVVTRRRREVGIRWRLVRGEAPSVG